MVGKIPDIIPNAQSNSVSVPDKGHVISPIDETIKSCKPASLVHEKTHSHNNFIIIPTESEKKPMIDPADQLETPAPIRKQLAEKPVPDGVDASEVVVKGYHQEISAKPLPNDSSEQRISGLKKLALFIYNFFKIFRTKSQNPSFTPAFPPAETITSRNRQSLISVHREKFLESVAQEHLPPAVGASPTPSTEPTALASGKAKVVYSHPSGVAYTPRASFSEYMTKANTREIRNEVVTQNRIKERLGEGRAEKSCISLNMKELPRESWIKGTYTVTNEAAGRSSKKNPQKLKDFDLNRFNSKRIHRSTRREVKRRARVAQQVFTAVATMHDINFLHRDLKLDNFLVFFKTSRGKPNLKKPQVKLSDFGKTLELSSTDKDKAVAHVGNPRSRAPEGLSSKKAEVFSTAQLIIQILEPALEDSGEDGMLVAIPPDKRDESLLEANQDLKGIERYVVLHKDCLQSESRTLRGRVSVVGTVIARQVNVRPSNEALQNSETAMLVYSTELVKRLREKKAISGKQAEALDALFLAMLASDPAKRPDAKEALATFEKIFKLKPLS